MVILKVERLENPYTSVRSGDNLNLILEGLNPTVYSPGEDGLGGDILFGLRSFYFKGLNTNVFTRTTTLKYVL